MKKDFELVRDSIEKGLEIDKPLSESSEVLVKLHKIHDKQMTKLMTKLMNKCTKKFESVFGEFEYFLDEIVNKSISELNEIEYIKVIDTIPNLKEATIYE
jgi:hypothetical protein